MGEAADRQRVSPRARGAATKYAQRQALTDAKLHEVCCNVVSMEGVDTILQSKIARPRSHSSLRTLGCKGATGAFAYASAYV